MRKVLEYTFESPLANGQYLYEGTGLFFVEGNYPVKITTEDDFFILNLKELVDASLYTNVPINNKELQKLSKLFDCVISFYPSGSIYIEKQQPSQENSERRIFVGIYESNQAKYGVSIFYYEQQPGLFLAEIDAIFLIQI